MIFLISLVSLILNHENLVRTLIFSIPLSLSAYLIIFDLLARKLHTKSLFRSAEAYINRIKIVDFFNYRFSEEYRDKITLPRLYKDAGYNIIWLHNGFGAWSERVSDCLIKTHGAGIAYYCDASVFVPPAYVRNKIQPHIELNRTLSSKHFHDGDKVRFCTDLIIDKDGKLPPKVRLQKAQYLTNLATNDISFMQVIDARTRRIIYNGFDFFLKKLRGAKYELRPYPVSLCSNQIGVSVLAFTSDGYLTLVDQTAANIESAGLLAPSGSGSLDGADITSINEEQDFMELLFKGAKRELREELGIEGRGQDTIQSVDILPIGFASYLFRGGKPEFFFLASLGCTWQQLSEQHRHSDEEQELSQLFASDESYRIKGEKTASVHAALVRMMNDLKDKEGIRLSFQLEMLTEMVEYACTGHPDEIDRFFNRA
ncbi:hypothetical protein [Sphingorhabdus sp. Alg239-R122]|uniref:hypothetical protein n=1 Tax=Sphingorhabdus sp. Alg239-R122 TaxID=2305989 RepID=UPI0013DA7B7E|nr:hypothetical protein [Sphingorhabdus sp. Alg239-R122]